MRKVVQEAKRAFYILGYYRRELSARWSSTIAGVTKRSGTTRQPRPQPLIISLTTIPARLSKVHITIHHLLQQSVQPDRIILWITEEMARALPKPLRRQQARGLEIRVTTDIGPLTKFLPCRQAYPQALIVTADDDIFYPRDWLGPLYAAYQREPQFIHAHRAHEITFAGTQPRPYAEWNWQAPEVQCASMRLIATGVGGVLYAPGHLHSEVTNTPVYRRLCHNADDIWLKVMAVMQGTACKKVNRTPPTLREVRFANNVRLGLSNYYHGGNDRQLAAVLNHYQIRLPDNNHPP